MRAYVRCSLRRAAWAALAAAAILLLSSPAFAAAGSGTAAITPSSSVPAGSAGTWTIQYTAADTFTTGTIEIVIPAGWTAPQAADPASAGYVTASSMGTLGAPALTIAGRIITVHVAALDTSQTVDVVYGDPSIDVLGRSLAQTAAQSGVEFAVSSDPAGASPAPLATSPALDVIAGPIAKLVFLTPPRTFTADGESAVIRVRTEDEFGNPAAVPGSQNVNLSSSAGSGRFSHLGGTNFVQTGTVTIASGEDTVSLYYRDAVAGGKTITAAPGGQSWTDAQQAVTVQAGAPLKLMAFPADTTITAGDFVRYRLRVEDAEGNPSPPSNNQMITLAGAPGSFYTTSNHGAAITQIGIASGTSTVYLDYQNTNKAVTVPFVLEFLDQDGILPALEAASANVFVDNAPFNPGASEISAGKPSAIANAVDSIEVTVHVKDIYGNGVDGATVVLASSGSGNFLRQPAGTTGNTGTAVGSIKSTKAEGKTLTAKVDGVDITASTGVTFMAGLFSPGVSTVVISPSTVVANGVDTTVVTVTVKDAEGNPISGSSVTLESTGGPNTIRQPVGLTGANGIAVGSVKSTKAETKTITAKVGGVAITTTRNASFVAGPFSPGVSTVVINPSTVVANGVDTTVVTVTVKDAQGNPISGSSVTLESTGGPNTIRQPVGLTGGDGIAVGSLKSTKAETKRITAKVGGVEIAITRNVTFGAGPFSPVSSEVHVDKTTAMADGVDAITVTVYAFDAQGNGIAGKTVTIAATGSGNVYNQPVGQTDQNGRAIGSLKSTVAEGKTISAKADGADIAETVPVTFSAGALHHFNVTHGGTAMAGDASSVTVDARDIQNNKITGFAGLVKVYTSSTIPGDYITWGLGNAAGSILSEVGDTVRYQFVPADLGDAELRITDTKVESVTIYASSGSVTSLSATPLVVSHAAPDRMILVSGNNQRAVVNQEVASALVVMVEDAFANPISGVTVTWAITKGGGYFDASRSIPGTQATSTTAADGTTAGELWRLGTVSGLNSDGITASMPSGSTRSVAFAATTDFGPISSIVLTPASKSVTVSSATIVTATLRDVFNNLVANEYVTIFVKDAPDGHLSRAAGSTTDSLSALMRRGRSDSTGTVRVTYNAPASAGLQDVIDAYSNTIPAGNVADVTYTTVASGATDLRATVLTGQTSQAGVPFSFRVEAVDGNGNRDLTNTSRIVLDPQTGAGFTFSLTNFGATITEANLASGALTLYGRGTKPGVWRTNVHDKASVLADGHFDVTVVPNDTVSSYHVLAPSNATVGSDFIVSAEARDRFGNTAISAGYQINFRAVQAADSTRAASGTLSVSSGNLVSGAFNGTNFRYNVAELMRIEVTSAANAVKGYSGIVAVGHAVAYQLVKLAGDSTGVSVGDSLRLRAKVVDIYGNAVSGQTVFFTVQQGGGHLAAPQALTDANGRVSLWFRTGTVRGTNVARASILDGDPEGLETQTFTVTTVPKTTIARVTLAIPGGMSYHAGEVFAGNVAAFDQYNNLIDTDSSSRLRCVARHPTMSFVPGVMTLSAGTASFTASDTLVGVNRIRVLSFAGDSLSDWSGPITIQPASTYRIVKVRGDTLGVRVGAKVGLKTRVSDRYGNAVSAEIVRFVITSNLGGSPSLWDGTGAPNDGIVLSDAMGAAVCSLTTDSHAGVNAVSASILDANPPALERVTFSVGTSAGTIARFDVIPDGFSKKAAQNFSLQIIAYDLNGNVATADDTSRVFLGSNGSAVFSINPVTLSHGQATVTVHDNRAESLILSAQTFGGGALSHSGAITVSPEVPAGAITFASIVPDSITANGTSLSNITSQPVKDAYGNVVAPLTLIRVTPSLGTVASDDQDPSTPLTFERQTAANGTVSVLIRSATSPGPSTVVFQSVTGSASGNATVHFMPAPACTYAGYLTPRYLVPGDAVSFRCSVTNASPTRLNLTTQSCTISFADGSAHTYEARLAAPAFLKGSSTDTLDFEAEPVPEDMLGGSYTPRVKLVGTDRYGSPYQVEFNAGSNSVSVSVIEIVSVTSSKSIVSRGDTFEVDVRVKNGGGSTVSMSDIVPRSRHTHGYYALVGAWNPALPNSLPASTEREYRASMRVFTNSPLGADTIDASATANINGSQVQDTSAYPNVAPIFIQSAATVAYVAGTLSPSVVSRGQSHSFSLSLRNTGDAVVILDGAKTKLTFTDGVHPVQVALGSARALPGNQVTGITFPAVAIPLAMSAGSWPVKLYLGGTENGGSFADTLNLSDSVEVVAPAHLVYHSGTLAPTTVSKRSAVAFSLGVDNTGGAPVECIPDSTWITFKNGSIVYLARLDGTFGMSVEPGLNTLYFSSVTVPDAMPAGLYSATVRVKGTENGLPFSTSFVLSNQISVQDPSRISIDRIVVPQSVTRSQSASWPVWMILKNNGEASVVINLNVAKTFISFNIVGLGDRTYEYAISRPTHLEGSGSDTLAGGALDSLLFVVTTTGSTTGLALVNGRVEGTDINSGLTVFDDTYNGGFSHMVIQMPGAPQVAQVLPSRTTVTSGQTTPWQITVEVCNSGEAALTLKMDSTYVFYDGRLHLSYPSPAGFYEGGLVLEGGSCKRLVFDISPTPLIPAGADIALHAHVGLTENNSAVYSSYDTRQSGSGFGTIRVQAPAKLRIVQVTNKAPRSPYVNVGQGFPVLVEVRNEGEARADSIRIALEKSGSSTIADTLILVGSLNGASSVADTFRVTAGASSGLETFRAFIRGALDDNSHQTSLVSVLSAVDDTTRAMIQGLAALAVTSVTPSQPEVNANQSVDWTVRVSIKNNGEAPLALGALAASDISFARGGVELTDYIVVAPDTLASGAHALTLVGGDLDALIYRVVSTGSDTGTVAIGALVSWHDMNDPGRAPQTASGTSSVHVKPPSGLRIISVTSDAPNNALFPNTSIVDVGQVFNVTVRVENTGGDDLEGVEVSLVSSGGSAIVGAPSAAIPSKSEKDFVFSVTAAPAPGTEILSSSITHAVSRNTGQPVIPAQAVESVENLRVELPALLSISASVTAPAGARDDTLSTGQSFVVTALVMNEGQAAIDTLGEVTLVLPSSMRLAGIEPLVKRFTAGRAMSWTVVAPAVSSQDTVKALISRIPNDVNRAAPAAVHIGEAHLALRTELAARLSGCAVSIDAPPGAVDGTLSTEQDFLVHSVFTPSANADSVWVELTVPGNFSVTGDRTKYIGRGSGTPRTVDWAVKAPSAHVASDTLVTRAGGKDVNSLLPIQTCRAVFPVHVLVKPSLALSAGISGPHEALDGVVSTDMPFTVTASAALTGEASIDTAGARIVLVLPAGQGYTLDGAGEHYRKAFSPGQPVVWNIRAPGSPTSPSNIEVKFAEPYATDVNTNAACTITAGDVFIPVQTEAGSVLMSNISREDSIPPYVVPQGARGVPIMRIVLRNNSGYTIGLDTVFVAVKDGRGNRIVSPARSIAQVALVALGNTFAATVTSDNPVAIVVAHGVEALPGTSDTLLMRADIASGAPAGEIRLEIEHSRDVVMSVTISGGGAGPRVGVSLEGTGGDIAGHFLSGPLSIMSGRFDEYVHNYPNPFRAGTEPTKICYFLKQDANVVVKIYDLGGSLVRSMRMGPGSAGGTGAPEGTWHEIPWDGRNDRGELVRNGVYLCKVEAGSQSALIKIAVAK